MYIGQRIKQRRKELNLSIDDIASALNKDRSTIYRYENNNIEKIPITILLPLAEILKTTPSYLMDLENLSNPNITNTLNTNTEKEITEMPELSRFFNIIIRMIYNDTSQHHKPHIHVQYNEYEATIGIDGELLAGSLPVKQLRLVEAWIVIHEEELYKAWNNAVRSIPFDKIAPLS